MSILSQLTSGAFPTDRTEFFRAHIRPDGKSWSFKRREYLQAIVTDTARDIVVRKPAQIGVSTLAIGSALHDASQERKVGYYLPSRDFMAKFVQARINPLINSDDDLAKAVIEGNTGEGEAANARARRKSADNTRLMQMGPGRIWFQGLQSLNDVKSVDLDSIYLDEFDELDVDYVQWVDDRTLASPYKHVMSLSQPSVPDMGIDALFQTSDQKFFHLKCSRCNTWCNLIEDWPACFVELKSFGPSIVCHKCHARISLDTAKGHQWIAKHPGRVISGYALSQLYGPFCDGAEVARRVAKAETSMAARTSITISVVGLPFAGDKQPLPQDVVSKACRNWPVGPPEVLNNFIPEALRQRPLRLAGIDQGDIIYALAAQEDPEQRLAIFDIRTFAGGDRWAQLTYWLQESGITFFLLDAAPETSEATRLVRTPELHGGKVYFTDIRGMKTDFLEPNHSQPILAVSMERNAAIDEMAGTLVSGGILLPAEKYEIINTVKAHCAKLAKVPNPKTWRLEYAKQVTNHFGLALTYLHMAQRTCEMLHI